VPIDSEIAKKNKKKLDVYFGRLTPSRRQFRLSVTCPIPNVKIIKPQMVLVLGLKWNKVR